LRQAISYHKRGHDIPLFTVNSDMKEVRFHVERIQQAMEAQMWVDNKKNKIVFGASALEFVMSMLPIGMRGDDIKKEVEDFLNKHSNMLERQYYNLGRPSVQCSDRELYWMIGCAVL